MIAPLCCAVSLFLKITVQAGTSFKISSCRNCFYIINVSFELEIGRKNICKSGFFIMFLAHRAQVYYGRFIYYPIYESSLSYLEELNKTHKELRLRIKITKQDPSDDRSYLSALSYLLAPELADFCNCPDSRCFRLMNTKDNAITVRITPRT
ncbi:hypothetical protein D3C76_955520 [compost metagenome]